jgi:peptide chain release factor 1
MATLSENRIRQIIDRFDQIEARMGVATDSKEIVQLSRDHAELRPVVEKARRQHDVGGRDHADACGQALEKR